MKESRAVIAAYAVDLPATWAEMEKLRVKPKRNYLGPAVEESMARLWENPMFQLYLGSIENGKSVTGSYRLDKYEAAKMVKEEGEERGCEVLKATKPAAILPHLQSRLKPYNMSVAQRMAAAQLSFDGHLMEQGRTSRVPDDVADAMGEAMARREAEAAGKSDGEA